MKRRLFLLLILSLAACTNGGRDTENEDLQPTLPPIATTEDDEIAAGEDEEPFIAPEFTLTSIDGDTVSLSALRGQWVMLNFWATWCKPCVEEMPVLQVISETRDDLVLLGINVREDPQLVEDFLAEHGITYTILMTPQSAEADQMLISYFPSGMALPQSVIIAPDGEIVWRDFSALELDGFSETLDSVIAEWEG
ncbi:MAG: TlpA family protein disulfide reductase [Chloroflexi bacterium]|nr:TlpA family protein disulfide reductase [Chloroflexota bacterium]